MKRLSRRSRLAWFLSALLIAMPIGVGDFAGARAHAEEASANSAPGANDVTARLLSNVKGVVPGKDFKLGVELTMQPGWHTYYKESGDAGMPTRVEWTLPEGFQAGEIEWRKPTRFDETGIITYGYKDKTVVAATIKPPADLPAGKALRFVARVKWLGCKEVCVPGKATVSLELPSVPSTEPDNADSFSGLGFAGPLPTASDSQTRNILDETIEVEGGGKPQSLAAYLALAFVGGFILNFMPCVLPVISIKVLSFVAQAGEDPKRVFHLGAIFTAGILSSFLALGALVVGIQQAGQSVGWGFQFQYPGFLIAMSVVVLLLALSLFGLFYVNVNAGQAEIDKLAGKEGAVGTFFKGVLATTLATPCTAPFLGTALGFAFTQPGWVVLAIFFTVGLGMSFPYLLLTAKPGWMKFIPKPGVWMETFKESMGFVLLGTVLWLLSVLGKQVGVEGVIWTSGFLLAVAFSAWLVGRLTDLTSTSRRKAVVWALALTVTGTAYYLCIASVPGLGAPLAPSSQALSAAAPGAESGPIDWQPFSLPALNKELSEGKTVFLDFTAQWCLTCKVNEGTVIATAPVAAKFKALNVVPMRADWTTQDADITKLLRKFGRSGVPLYVIFPAGRPTRPIVLPEVITQPLVLEKLDEAASAAEPTSSL